MTRLCSLRGVSTLTAFGLAVEIGDWDRLTGRTIGAYLGLVPCEYSSGATRAQGSITKTGNTHARRLLIEAAWYHRLKRSGDARDDVVVGYMATQEKNFDLGAGAFGVAWALQAAAHHGSWVVEVPATRACANAVASGNAPGLRTSASR